MFHLDENGMVWCGIGSTKIAQTENRAAYVTRTNCLCLKFDSENKWKTSTLPVCFRLCLLVNNCLYVELIHCFKRKVHQNFCEQMSRNNLSERMKAANRDRDRDRNRDRHQSLQFRKWTTNSIYCMVCSQVSSAMLIKVVAALKLRNFSTSKWARQVRTN